MTMVHNIKSPTRLTIDLLKEHVYYGKMTILPYYPIDYGQGISDKLKKSPYLSVVQRESSRTYTARESILESAVIEITEYIHDSSKASILTGDDYYRIDKYMEQHNYRVIDKYIMADKDIKATLLVTVYEVTISLIDGKVQ